MILKLKDFCYDTPELLAKLFEEPVEKLGIAEILAGWSGSWSCYEESIWILYIGTDGNLYEASGSHYSCYGYEDQWCSGATSWEYLMSDKFGVSGMEAADVKAVREFAEKRAKGYR